MNGFRVIPNGAVYDHMYAWEHTSEIIVARVVGGGGHVEWVIKHAYAPL
jgi:hypothetical protein